MYKFREMEPKWQKIWEKEKAFEAINESKKPKYYYLVEFPYPSGSGLHVGHVRSYTALDVLARKKRMEGFNVLFPIGWDAFGLPAENYAIQNKMHPKEAVIDNIKVFKGQLQMLGISFDWSRELATTDPEYVKWTQWQFLKFYEHGLAYKDKKLINWCLSCKTGLANEEVEAGFCERCGGEITRREKSQWMLKMKSYAEKLIAGLDETDFVERVKNAQINWIGKSEGVTIKFALKEINDQIEVYTTRPDTTYGATFMVLAPEHPIIKKYENKITNLKEVIEYQARSVKKSEFERVELNKEKTGIKIEGLKVLNPLTNNEIPIFISDYVMMGYGTGAIMAVPAHDDRDFDFANKFKIPIIPVIKQITGEKRKEAIFKNSIIAILYDEENEKYLTLNWGEKGGRLFIGGSVVENESYFDCALREIKEETGYVDVELIRESFPINHNYYAYNKNKAYTVNMTGFLFKINSKRKEATNLDEDEIDNFKVEWVSKDVVLEEVKDEGHSTLFANLILPKPFLGEGIMINSPLLNEITNMNEAKEIIFNHLEKTEQGKRTVTYRLQDWIFSRQRFWGEPIPMIYCNDCGWVPVPEADLPILLPDIPKYEPTDDGESPLANIPEWYLTTCPKCGKEARRETDTMPNWAGSSWYWLRYMDPHNTKEFVSQEALKYWGQVDWYNGGMEHATRHLLYARFWQQFLYDIGLVPTKEPFKIRTAHGMILGKGNVKMSKSLGNVINPDDMIKLYGADSLRVYELFIGDYEKEVTWNEQGIVGAHRFLNRVYNLKNKSRKNINNKTIEQLLNQTIKKVTEDIETMKYNTAVSALMILLNEIEKLEFIGNEELRIFLCLLNPMAPHITEELNRICELGEPIYKSRWPKYDESKIIPDKFEMVVQVNGKVRGKIEADINITKEEMEILAKTIDNVKRYIEGKEIIKVIVIPKKMINIVVK